MDGISFNINVFFFVCFMEVCYMWFDSNFFLYIDFERIDLLIKCSNLFFFICNLWVKKGWGDEMNWKLF